MVRLRQRLLRRRPGAASVSLDTELLSGSSYDPRVYTGAWNSPSSIPVYNAECPADGIAQGGDSGSAAYAYTSSSQASVRGLTVAVDNTFRTAQCGGNPAFAPHMTCSARAFAVNAVDALSGLGVRIKTTS